ncbi:MAG: leucine-rich repeat domain-containing protein [Clostridia bacterium]|nr:leucine-rich repeat domain-containing protein [Clostridia bacterium]
MKKIIGILSVLLLVSVAAFCFTACGEGTEEAENTAPVSFKYTLVTEDDDADGYYVLESVTLSDKAQTLVGKKDYEGLKTLFNTKIEGVYEPLYVYGEEHDVRTLEIPATYNDKAVKEIAAEAVVNQTFVKKIVVGDNVTKIGAGAFQGLAELEEITLPFVGGEYNAKNDKKLFGYIFGSVSATGLDSVTQNYNEGTSSSATYYIPASLKKVTVTGDNKVGNETLKYKIDADGKYIWETDEGYADAEGEEKEIPAEQNYANYEYSVAPYAFYNCASLETVELEGEIPTVPDYAFYGCSGLKKVSFNDDTTAIGKYAYSNCSGLKEVDFNNVETIGNGAFAHCSALGSAYADQDNELVITATKVGADAFHGCSGIETVKFTNAADIGEMAFHECASLTAVTFDNGAANIGNYAFAECSSLETVTGLGAYDGNAFYGTPYAENKD